MENVGESHEIILLHRGEKNHSLLLEFVRLCTLSKTMLQVRDGGGETGGGIKTLAFLFPPFLVPQTYGRVGNKSANNWLD